MQGSKSYGGRSDPPALTREAREMQLFAKAERLAEERIEKGTASNALLLHYLKEGSLKAKKERELLDAQVALAKAKTESYESAARIEELYKQAESVFKKYAGMDDEHDAEVQ